MTRSYTLRTCYNTIRESLLEEQKVYSQDDRKNKLSCYDQGKWMEDDEQKI